MNELFGKFDTGMNKLVGVLATVGGDGGSNKVTENTKWRLDTFLQNLAGTAKTWGGYFIVFLGIVMIIVSAWQLGSGLMSHGKKQTNWAVAVILLILGGAFAVGGFNFLSNIASGGAATINSLGSMILIR